MLAGRNAEKVAGKKSAKTNQFFQLNHVVNGLVRNRKNTRPHPTPNPPSGLDADKIMDRY